MKNLADSVGVAVCASSSPEIGECTVCRLFISPGHNFFEHHGRPAGHHPTLEVDQIECVSGRGIRGDRFFDYKENYKGQITFFSQEVFEKLKGELGLADLSPSATRRNVLVCGLQLNDLIGTTFEIQGVAFEGVEECRPCYWMDQAIGQGTEKWLSGRGGLRARIVTTGVLRVARSQVRSLFSFSCVAPHLC